MECPKCKSAISDDSQYCKFCGMRLTPSGRIRDSSTQRFPRHHELAAGSSFLGRYEIIEELGRGGMGIVYKAEDTKLKRNVALKFLPSEFTRNAEAKERFVHEAQAASALDHPNICSVHEIEETDDGQMYISMGCYEGETLQEKIRQAPLIAEEAADIGIQVAQGLQEAHEKGIIHRDVKPSNVIITTKGQAKIMDFGLAKLGGQTRLTKDGTTMGTVAYMSPEQAQGEGIDHRTDIWSLGVMLYEMVTGELPFKGEYDQAVIYSILNEEPKPLAELNTEVQAGFGSIVAKCLKRDPGERYQSASDLVMDLSNLREGRPSRWYGSGTMARSPSKPLAGKSLLKVGIPLAVMIVAVVAILMYTKGRQGRGLVGTEPAQAEMHVAILPFECDGGSSGDEAFCDGLVQTVTDKLARLESPGGDFWVVPYWKVVKQAASGAGEAGRQLRANVILTGDLSRLGDRYQLSLVRNDVGLQSHDGVETETVRQQRIPPITDPIGNLATWQDSIVLRVARALGRDKGSQVRSLLIRGGTAMPLAYQLYLRGRGQLYPHEGKPDIDLAINSLSEAIDNDSSYAMAHVALGQAYFKKYQGSGEPEWVDLTIEQCNRAIKLDDGIVSAHVALGKMYADIGEYEEAVSAFDRVLELEPANIEALQALGDTHRDQGNDEEAEAAYRMGIEMRPDLGALHYRLGYLYWMQNRFKEAVEPFKTLTVLEPKNPIGYSGLGVAYFELERIDDARVMFERSLATGDTMAITCSNLGTIYFWDGRYADAARLYKKAIEFKPSAYTLYAHLAEAYYWDPDQAEKAPDVFRKAIGLAQLKLEDEPGSVNILTDLAGYYGKVGETARAGSLLVSVVDLEPSDPTVMLHIAEIYEEMGKRDLTLEWIEKALKKGFPLIKLNRYPGLGNLRADERFRDLLRDYGENT
jgi:tetratricopeptide (TPR) repeat protein/TolB-like protein